MLNLPRDAVRYPGVSGSWGAAPGLGSTHPPAGQL